jgi:hypothetical protein
MSDVNQMIVMNDTDECMSNSHSDSTLNTEQVATTLSYTQTPATSNTINANNKASAQQGNIILYEQPRARVAESEAQEYVLVRPTTSVLEQPAHTEAMICQTTVHTAAIAAAAPQPPPPNQFAAVPLHYILPKTVSAPSVPRDPRPPQGPAHPTKPSQPHNAVLFHRKTPPRQEQPNISQPGPSKNDQRKDNERRKVFVVSPSKTKVTKECSLVSQDCLASRHFKSDYFLASYLGNIKFGKVDKADDDDVFFSSYFKVGPHAYLSLARAIHKSTKFVLKQPISDESSEMSDSFECKVQCSSCTGCDSYCDKISFKVQGSKVSILKNEGGAAEVRLFLENVKTMAQFAKSLLHCLLHTVAPNEKQLCAVNLFVCKYGSKDLNVPLKITEKFYKPYGSHNEEESQELNQMWKILFSEHSEDPSRLQTKLFFFAYPHVVASLCILQLTVNCLG